MPTAPCDSHTWMALPRLSVPWRPIDAPPPSPSQSASTFLLPPELIPLREVPYHPYRTQNDFHSAGVVFLFNADERLEACSPPTFFSTPPQPLTRVLSASGCDPEVVMSFHSLTKPVAPTILDFRFFRILLLSCFSPGSDPK